MDKYLLLSDKYRSEAIADKFNCKLISVITLSDAIEHIKNDKIVGVLLDEPLPSSLKLGEVLSQLNVASSIPLKIAFSTSRLGDIAYYQKLKEEMRITWVLPAPLNAEMAQALFFSLFSHVDQAKNGEYRPSQPLIERFEKSIFEKLKLISAILDKIHQEPTIILLTQLKGEMHKIAGSAAPYGFKTAGLLCKQLEHYLSPFVGGNYLPESLPLLTYLDAFKTKLILAFQHIQTEKTT